MEIDPRRLRILLAVGRTGGVLAAADELRISPSAVSQQITKLERETGRALVRRTPRGTVLTQAGEALAEAAEEIERALNLVRTRLEGGSELEGTVRIGGFSSFLRTVLIPQLPAWRAHYPNLRVQVIEDDLPVLMRLLRRRELDAVVVELDYSQEESVLPAGIVEEPLLDEPWKLVVPAGSLRSGESVDLRRLPLPWLGVETTAASASAVGRLGKNAEVDVPAVHRYQETLTALALVAAGEGVTVVPLLALNGVVQEGVDLLDVPGLGTRRIVLRRFDHRRVTRTPADTVARLLRNAVASLDFDGLISG